MRGFLSSFRGRLTVMSLIILALGLSAYSWVVGFINLSQLSSHINADLTQRGRMLARGGPPGMRVLNGQRGGDFIGDRNPPIPGQRDSTAPPEHPGGDQPPGTPQLRDGPGGPRPRQGDDAFFGGREPGPNADLRRARFLGPGGLVIGGLPDDHAFDFGLFQRGMRGEEAFADQTIEGQLVRVFATPWYRGDRQQGVVEVARDLRDYDDLRHTQFWTWITLTPLALALSAFGAFVLAGKTLKPIQTMQKAASAIGQGDFSRRLAVNGDDELANLAQAFNVMAASLQKSFADQAAAYENLKEAYESQKRFTADASHELRTPLARVQLATSSALRGPEAGYREALEIADGSAKSMAKLIRELLVLARADAGQLGLKHDPFDLRLAVSDALNGFKREIGATFPHSTVIIEGDQDHLERVVANLVENAIRHTAGDKPINVSLAVQDGKAILYVEDAGSGIAPDHLPHLFDRFYRADGARGIGDGVGLGLAICKSVVEGHGGTISVRSEVGEGTRFEVALPLAKS
jgi:two-component system OmpR family sensor kinase